MAASCGWRWSHWRLGGWGFAVGQNPEGGCLNRLVLHAALDWDAVAVLRAYRRYRHQVAPQDDEAYVDEVLVAVPVWAPHGLDQLTPGQRRPGRPQRAGGAGLAVKQGGRRRSGIR